MVQKSRQHPVCPRRPPKNRLPRSEAEIRQVYLRRFVVTEGTTQTPFVCELPPGSYCSSCFLRDPERGYWGPTQAPALACHQVPEIRQFASQLAASPQLNRQTVLARVRSCKSIALPTWFGFTNATSDHEELVGVHIRASLRYPNYAEEFHADDPPERQPRLKHQGD